jgi:hypothetical protein
MVKNGNIFYQKIVHKNAERKMVKITKIAKRNGKQTGK